MNAADPAVRPQSEMEDRDVTEPNQELWIAARCIELPIITPVSQPFSSRPQTTTHHCAHHREPTRPITISRQPIEYNRARVSQKRQRDALIQAGCERVFDEHASGARDDRPELAAALSHARPGDVLDRRRRSPRSNLAPDLRSGRSAYQHDTAIARCGAASLIEWHRAPTVVYCASVPPSVRCVSAIVLRTRASVSVNVRRKGHSIARRGVHSCAPLQVPTV
jgi:hypothetical protein